MVVSILCLFLTMPWVGLQCVIVEFPGQIYYILPAKLSIRPMVIAPIASTISKKIEIIIVYNM